MVNGLKDHHIAQLVSKVAETLHGSVRNLPQSTRAIVGKAAISYLYENNLMLDSKKAKDFNELAAEGHVLEYTPGDLVEKVGGDYELEGTVVASFFKNSGEVRYVVEADTPRGLLHIYSGKNLRRRAG